MLAAAVLGLMAGGAGRARANIIVNFDDVNAPQVYSSVTPGGAFGPTYARSGDDIAMRRAMWLWVMTGAVPTAHIVADDASGPDVTTTRRSSRKEKS